MGCADDLVISAKFIPMFHELVHGVLHRGRSGPFILVEGLAVALSGAIVENEASLMFDPEDLLEGPDQEYIVESYASAGRFVRYLINTYGAEDVVLMLRTAADSSSGVDVVISEIADQPWSDIVSAYRAEEPCEGFIEESWECSAPEIEESQGSWTVAEVLSCRDSEHAVGTIDYFWTRTTIKIPEDGEYRVTSASDPGVSAFITPCGGCDPSVVLIGYGQQKRVFLTRGVYSVGLGGVGGSPLNLLFRVERLSGPDSGTGGDP
ncbi:MAG TPA: hypothetical protein ENK31_05585 [Nannocystis exedens]|nr:hypothetical protein [Nannocystis exedens]